MGTALQVKELECVIGVVRICINAPRCSPFPARCFILLFERSAIRLSAFGGYDTSEKSMVTSARS